MATNERAFVEEMRICSQSHRDKALQKFKEANSPRQQKSEVEKKIRQAAELGLYRTPLPLADAAAIHTHCFDDTEILEALQPYRDENSYGLKLCIQRNSQGVFEEVQMDWQYAPSAHGSSSPAPSSSPDENIPHNRRTESGYRT